MEEVNKPATWNKTKIFVALFLLLLLIVGGYFFKTRYLGESSPQQMEFVKGASIQENIAAPGPSINIQEAVKERIDSLKQQVSSLNISDIASSSPQVQKILNDIKSLQQYPTNQVKEICRKICGL